ncbi:hypothetical protein [Nostoc sp. 106C]|jgi:hypothetical protein|uniref:hypothetical protein n=1 Tax=Nostoc sp. 106C TaxID=1932667 RepID=UPI000A3A5882|nr:hypothetical protein [Nostoc sp. 106C]OUL21002.1 hypothetical protein BV378_27450 [Nostoc sp. RF31YmG]OUL23556.1 hypothetical protein BV375_25795 [Nostoc sp. 106C]
MLQSRWFKILHSLGLEFWLPLPLLGLAFWLGCGFLMDAMLTRSHQTIRYLKVDTQLTKQPNRTVLSIQPEINKRLGISRVKVKTDSPVVKELQFEFFVTDLTQLEAAISQELGLPVEDVRKLMQHQPLKGIQNSS